MSDLIEAIASLPPKELGGLLNSVPYMSEVHPQKSGELFELKDDFEREADSFLELKLSEMSTEELMALSQRIELKIKESAIQKATSLLSDDELAFLNDTFKVHL
ncbi:hypothetical protein HGP28_08105 [Vibrio sp. SM6]|uniref:Uncharacterized protein n=1 Tax=Vibrio agarilyticus TaxID=2726741 RepID=A0A7X8TQB5_9VIBR|nr:hypothetical protein [Vibrio agarilyticus]NLS12861.1 hypothetical protein [Vibrio agarilyticus]